MSAGIAGNLLMLRGGEIADVEGADTAASARHVATLGAGSRGAATPYGSGSLGGASSLHYAFAHHYHYASTPDLTGDGAGRHAKPPQMWRQRARVHGRAGAGRALPWERFPLDPPPDPDRSLDEIATLHDYQARLRRDEPRRREIPAQAAGDVPVELLRPLGIDELGGFAVTRRLMLTVFEITADVGFAYKAMFARPRPNTVDPTLRPALGNPPHLSYPSNHSFQFFSAAEVMSRTVPEIGATSELFFAAQRVAENREYAGVHYRSDSEAGRRLAQWFLPYLAEACRELMLEARREWIR